MASLEVDPDAWAAENKGPWIISICWVVTGLSTIFVLARFYVRGWLKRKLQQDDLWIGIAMICGYLSTALSTVAVSYGNGKHMQTLTKTQQEAVLLWTFTSFCPGLISFGLPKLAVVYLLVKLMNPGKWHRYFLWWLGIWCQLTLFAAMGVLFGHCTPIQALWDIDITDEKCFSMSILISYSFYAGAFAAFVDIYLAIYPAIVLFNLRLSTKKKITLSFALGIGSVSGIVAVYKITRIPSLGSKDFSYDSADLVVWTAIEGSTMIIASTIPVLRPLVQRVMPRDPFQSTAKSFASNGQYSTNYSAQTTDHEPNQRKKSKTRADLELGALEEDGSQEEMASSGNPSIRRSSIAFAATESAASMTRVTDRT